MKMNLVFFMLFFFISNCFSEIISGSFCPDQLHGCVLWLDTTDIDTITLNGSKVTQWDDKSISGNDVAQSTEASQPTYEVDSMSGKSSLFFNGAQYLERADGDCTGLDMGAGDFTVISVFSSTTTSSGATIAAKGAGNVGAKRYILALVGSVPEYSYFELDDNTAFKRAKDFDVVNFDGNPHMLIGMRFGTDLKLYRDGGLKETIDITGYGDLDSPDPLSIGALWDKSGSAYAWFFEGNIGEVIIYNRVLNSSEQNQVEKYLSNKWGVSLL